jgi:hypothetical protein
MLSVANKPIMLSVYMLNVILLNDTMLNVIMLNVAMLSDIMLSVMAPLELFCREDETCTTGLL